MTDHETVLEKQLEAQCQLRDGLSGIEQAQAGIFGHLERMAAHLVALEAIVTVAARYQATPFEAVVQTIKARITAQGADEGAALSAIQVAQALLAAEPGPDR